MATQKPMSLRLPSELDGASPAPAAPRLELLGGFRVRVGGDGVLLPHHVQRLVAFLALQGRPLHRAYVAERLWMDLTQEHAHACLRTTLWRLGRLACPVVEANGTHVALGACVSVDVRELEACTETILHADGTQASADLDCLLRSSELLPDWYEDWILLERERLRQLRLLALEAAAGTLVGRGRYSQAAVAALAAVEADPLRESAYRILITSYIGEGNVAEALHQYGVFSAHLHRDLGLEPSDRMRELLRGVF